MMNVTLRIGHASCPRARLGANASASDSARLAIGFIDLLLDSRTQKQVSCRSLPVPARSGTSLAPSEDWPVCAIPLASGVVTGRPGTMAELGERRRRSWPPRFPPTNPRSPRALLPKIAHLVDSAWPSDRVAAAWAGRPLIPDSRCPRRMAATAELARVEMWRGCCRPNISVAASFVWRCLSGSTVAPFPHPAHRTGQADFPHPALGQDLTPLFWRATPSAGPEPFLEFIGRPISQVLHHVLRLS